MGALAANARDSAATDSSKDNGVLFVIFAEGGIRITVSDLSGPSDDTGREMFNFVVSKSLGDVGLFDLVSSTSLDGGILDVFDPPSCGAGLFNFLGDPGVFDFFVSSILDEALFNFLDDVGPSIIDEALFNLLSDVGLLDFSIPPSIASEFNDFVIPNPVDSRSFNSVRVTGHLEDAGLFTISVPPSSDPPEMFDFVTPPWAAGKSAPLDIAFLDFLLCLGAIKSN